MRLKRRRRFGPASLLFAALIIAAISLSLSDRSAHAFDPTPSGTFQTQQPTATPTPPEQDDVVRVSIDLVVLNVTVLDKNGKFVPGLKRFDFQILEDGVQQKASTFSTEETPFAAAILLDTSGSMESRLTLGRSAAIRFLDGLRDEDVAAVYSFNTKVEQWSDFTPGRDLPPRVYGLKTKTLTALNDAIVRAADDLAKREEKRRAIVVLSDGGENYSHASSDKALDRASIAGATIYGANMSEEGPKRDLTGAAILKSLAEKSGGRYIDAPGGL
ncbi:MAG TPA: VWA domain-containing protein, partial [Pyrinomonadaceae bacterium]|nr:VWA domain-containing protein [Pyrinomonadaceae bacterium]